MVPTGTGAPRRQRRNDHAHAKGLAPVSARVAVWRKTPKPIEKHPQTASGAPRQPGCSTEPDRTSTGKQAAPSGQPKAPKGADTRRVSRVNRDSERAEPSCSVAGWVYLGGGTTTHPQGE